MTTRNMVLRKAASYIGYVEKGNNITEFWARQKPSYQGGAWCAAFVVDVLEQCGNTLLKEVDLPYYTPAMESWARKTDRWGMSINGTPGDVLIFGNGHAVHTGFLEKQINDRYVQTIEGNTSSGNGGSQTNGGGVYRRIRPRSWIRGCIDMSDAYDRGVGASQVSSSDAPAPTYGGGEGKLDVDGSLGPDTIKALQRFLSRKGYNFGPHGGIDGQMPNKSFTLSAFQAYMVKSGIKAVGKADGVMGPSTARAMERFLGIKRESIPGWYPGLVRGLQRFLNENMK